MIILNIVAFIMIPILISMIIILEVEYDDTDKSFTTLCIFSVLILSVLLYTLDVSHL